MLQHEPGFLVVGEAQNGEEAVRMAARLKPDVITMDIRMPRMDGIEAVRQIMSTTPTPIVVVASSIYDSDLNIAFNAIAAGALTVVEKPKGLSPEDYEAVRSQLVQTLRLMAEVPVVTIWIDQRLPFKVRLPDPEVHLIAVAASTGGPRILKQILGALPEDFPIPIVVVQHITAGFVEGFVHWLDTATSLQVSVAKQGEPVQAGRVLVAPDDRHMLVAVGGVVEIVDGPPVRSVRPSATLLFESVAEAYGESVVAVVLTGMGEDGADGLEMLHEAGGTIFAQNEASCAVFGMPKEAIDRGVVDQILTPDQIVSALCEIGKHHCDGS
jgi:two-component system chemotaxis response regulator CheB